MTKGSKKGLCRYYRPYEGELTFSGQAEGCGSCVYFSAKNCRRHSADEIPDFFEPY